MSGLHLVDISSHSREDQSSSLNSMFLHMDKHPTEEYPTHNMAKNHTAFRTCYWHQLNLYHIKL